MMPSKTIKTLVPSFIRGGMLALAAAAPLVAGVPAAVQAQGADSKALLDRIERLERDIRTLNQQIARQGSQTPGAAPAQGGTENAPVVVGAAPEGGDGGAARAFVRLDALEREVRDLTGLTEGLSHRIDQLGVRLDKLLVDLDYRLARLEGGQPGSFSAEARGEPPQVRTAPTPGSVSRIGAMPPVSSEGGTVSKDGAYVPGQGENVGTLGTVSKTKLDQIVEGQEQGQEQGQAQTQEPAAPAPVQETVPQVAETEQAALPSALPAGTVREQYDYAWDLVRQARFVEAEEAFKAFIEAHPNDDLTGNARYWLAETYYVRKRYMDAAQAFFDAYKKAPEGNKAPDALLKLGMSMAGLEKTDEACTTFAKLRKEFTPLKANIEQALNREVQRLKCK